MLPPYLRVFYLNSWIQVNNTVYLVLGFPRTHRCTHMHKYTLSFTNRWFFKKIEEKKNRPLKSNFRYWELTIFHWANHFIYYYQISAPISVNQLKNKKVILFFQSSLIQSDSHFPGTEELDTKWNIAIACQVHG